MINKAGNPLHAPKLVDLDSNRCKMGCQKVVWFLMRTETLKRPWLRRTTSASIGSFSQASAPDAEVIPRLVGSNLEHIATSVNESVQVALDLPELSREICDVLVGNDKNLEPLSNLTDVRHEKGVRQVCDQGSILLRIPPQSTSGPASGSLGERPTLKFGGNNVNNCSV